MNDGTVHEWRNKCHQLEEQLNVANDKLNLEKEKNEQLRFDLLNVLKELDIVGILHGAGSKQRAKKILIDAMQSRYGADWNKKIKN